METELQFNDKSCRFCLKQSENVVLINLRIKENFKTLINLELLENPRFPQLCCQVCESDFEKFKQLKNDVQRNQKILQNSLENSSHQERITIKIEPALDTYFEDLDDTLVKQEQDESQSGIYYPEHLELQECEPKRKARKRTAKKPNKPCPKK